ncbi:ISAon1 family transposase N-terminal region protein, partial [Larkinella punicea]
MESFLPLIQFLLPEFILENFELTSIDRPDGVFHVYIEEKNADDPERKNLRSKGFFPTITVQDFPIRGHQVFLHIKRRRWLNTQTGKVVYRDWTQVGKGTRMTSEF